MSDKLTWTEIAIHLIGEVPVSCKMTEDGGLVATMGNGKRRKFTAKQVDDAIEDLDKITKSQGLPSPEKDRKPAAAKQKATAKKSAGKKQ